MRRFAFVLFTCGTACLAGGCASSGTSVHGRQVEVIPRAPDREAKVQGELLAVDTEKIWVLGKEQTIPVPLDSVQEVRVRRHSVTGKTVWRWTAIGAIVTGGALSLACASVEDAHNCGVAFLVVGATWALAGALAAPGLEASSKIPIRDPRPDDLRSYARFPQGLPEGMIGPPAPKPEASETKR